jgi:hypothetical protein
MGVLAVPRVEIEVEVTHKVVRVLVVDGEESHVFVPHVWLLNLLEPEAEDLLVDLWSVAVREVGRKSRT